MQQRLRERERERLVTDSENARWDGYERKVW